MSYKNNNGITLIALTITIIVLLIIAGISVYSGSQLIQQAKKEDVKTNMLLVQAEVKNFVEQAKFENKNIETLISEGVTVDNVNLKVAEQTVEGKKLYKIETPMSDLKLSKVDAEKYLVDIKIDEVDVDVYFVPGVTGDDGNIKHLLSELK